MKEKHNECDRVKKDKTHCPSAKEQYIENTSLEYALDAEKRVADERLPVKSL